MELSGGGTLSANTVLVASGVSYRYHDAPGFRDLTGAGIYYGAAMTEARSCADQHVVIIGGANSAGQAAVYFAGYASRVTMLVRSTLEKSMSHYLIEQIAALAQRRGPHRGRRDRRRGRRRPPRAPPRQRGRRRGGDARRRRVLRVHRRGAADGLARRRRRARRARLHPRGRRTRKAAGWPLKRDPYVLETTIPGIFVAGDVRARSIKRVASAVGEGSMAVSLIHQYLVDA